jgi:hypothetical protein
VKDFPDPFTYIIGFTCTSQIQELKRSTAVVSAVGERKFNESVHEEL